MHDGFPILSLRSLSKHFRGSAGVIVALSDVSLDCVAGERVLVCGMNGSGKTTLLRCCSGRVPPDTGAVSVAGASYGGTAAMARVLRRSIGFVPSTTDTMYPRLTVRHNLEFFCAPFHANRRAMGEALDYWIAALGLGVYERRMFQHCSSGIKKRVQWACALSHDPVLLLADEWDAMIDAATRARIVEALAARQGDRVCLCSAQSTHSAPGLWTRVVVLDAGRPLYAGTPAELCRRLGAASLAEAVERLRAEVCS